jgi:hypothetical protein
VDGCQIDEHAGRGRVPAQQSEIGNPEHRHVRKFLTLGDPEVLAQCGDRHVLALVTAQLVQAGVVGVRQSGQSDIAVGQLGKLLVHVGIAAGAHAAVGKADLDLRRVAGAGVRSHRSDVTGRCPQQRGDAPGRRGDVTLEVAYRPQPVAVQTARADIDLLDLLASE